MSAVPVPPTERGLRAVLARDPRGRHERRDVRGPGGWPMPERTRSEGHLMNEPHRVSADRWYHIIWWWIGGVHDGPYYMSLCARCGCRGEAHFDWRGCWRFK